MGLMECEALWRFSTIALGFAERFCDLAAKLGETAKLLLGERVTAISRHYLGEQAEARRILESMLSRYERDLHRWHTAGFRVDHGIVGRAESRPCSLAAGGTRPGAEHVARVPGRRSSARPCHDAAIRLERDRDTARAAGRRSGRGRRLTALLLDPAAKHGFFIWEACGRCFEAIRLVRSTNLGTGLPLLRAAVAKLRHTGFEAHSTFILSMLAEAMCDAGEIEEGLVTVDEGLARWKPMRIAGAYRNSCA